jgi:hypothetical protein
MLTAQSQCWKALLDGETIISENDGRMFKMIDDRLRWRRFPEDLWKEANSTFGGDPSFKIYKEPQWFDNSGNGILCRVRQFNSTKWYIVLIVSTSCDLCVAENGGLWDIAEPLPPEEVQKYIYRGINNG